MKSNPYKPLMSLGLRCHQRDSTAAHAPIGNEARMETRATISTICPTTSFLRAMARSGRIRRVSANSYVFDGIGLQTSEDLCLGPPPTCES